MAYRQAVRNVDKCLNFGGGMRRNQRTAFDRFLSHANLRVREYAERIKQDMQTEHKARAEAILEDECLVDDGLEPNFVDPRTEFENLLIDEEIPF